MEREPARSRLSPAFRVGLLSLGLTACAALLFSGFLFSADAEYGRLRIPLVVLAAAFAASELFVVHLQFRKEAHSISLNEIPLVLGLVLATPGDLILAHLLGAAVALLLLVR
ncbi:MAG: putative bifunctional diguanylate cyclase/phosphodiesterase, partial [Actinomycetota bacterium]